MFGAKRETYVALLDPRCIFELLCAKLRYIYRNIRVSLFYKKLSLFGLHSHTHTTLGTVYIMKNEILLIFFQLTFQTTTILYTYFNKVYTN